ncbi:hypothetical protein [Tateyamaria sp. SN3-11]|uniref:hypothetical protein n=1 Tax=Tateyamaria sp. SN3-11 TaxID=3092147 RepID=UPI0039EC097F
MIRIFLVHLFIFLAACDSTYDNQYRLQGAGIPLHTNLTDRNTDNLAKYFGALCVQAGFQSTGCAPSPGANLPGNWNLLVQTGYNDIDYRCDAYLNWIDSKRSERILFEGTTNALGTLAAGLLKGSSASADTLADIALALGFAKEVYASYQSSILLGLEGSTIKEIVNRRRLTHRQKFRTAKYNNRPEAIFALRRYLTYCTPQSILTDVNTFSRGAASGTLPEIEGDATAAAALLTSSSQVTPENRNPSELPTVASIADFAPFSEAEVKRIQAASCGDVIDGKVGPQTKRAVAMLHDRRTTFDTDPLISANEWTAIYGALKPCDIAKFKNIYENISHSDNDGKGVVNALANGEKIPRTLLGKPLNDPEVRKALSDARKAISLAEPKYGLAADSDQLTPQLYNALTTQ